jgi:acyl-CoA synthetase (AMP-forming)/AMP-acid ligase II
MDTRPWQRHYDYEVPVPLRYPRIPAQDFLHYAANGFPDKAAYQFYGSEMSFYDLRRQVLRLANALGGLGVQKGDRVGLHLPTSPQYVLAYHIKSPLVMQGYWNTPEEIRGQLKDGWLHTGDIAVWDEDDYLYIVDRKKDMIIAGGFNIYPREIDEVLFQHPQIQEAVCVGLADQYRGETVKAYVVLKEGATATPEEIVGFCKEHLAAYKVPKQEKFREALPKSAVGKILRKMLRDEEETKTKSETRNPKQIQMTQ